MFSDNEVKSIILAVLPGHRDGAKDCTLDDGIQQVLDWGSKVRTQSLLLDLIIAGQVAISVMPSGEIRFSRAAESSVFPPTGDPW